MATALQAGHPHALRDKADALAKSRRDADRALARARIQLTVLDAKWDTTVAALGRAVVDVAGGRRDQADYLRFFGKAPPSVVQDFGIQREIDSARGWLVELARDPNHPLSQTWTPRLKAATDELEMTFNRRRDCQRAIEPLQTAVLLLIDDVNHELNRLEGDLKKLFPVDVARVASYLSATRATRQALANEPAPAPSPAVKQPEAEHGAALVEASCSIRRAHPRVGWVILPARSAGPRGWGKASEPLEAPGRAPGRALRASQRPRPGPRVRTSREQKGLPFVSADVPPEL